MSWGSTNEYLIFPIIDLIRKEVKSLIARGVITQESFMSKDGNILVQKDSTTNKIEYNTSLMARLESNDFDLVLEKNDPDNPKRLTSVVIKYGEDLKQVISLLREENKLKYVKIAVILNEPIENAFANPLGMSGDDFVQYIINKRTWSYYKTIYDNEESTSEQKNEAELKMTYVATLNQQLRNNYGVDGDVIAYEELVKYIPNPLGMTTEDYIKYILNKWIWISTHSDITQNVTDQAAEENQQLRDKYYILEDVGTYEEYAQYLPNPLGMYQNDFIEYMRLREEFLTIEDPEDVLINEAERKALLDKYYREEDNYTYEELVQYLPEDSTLFNERTILKILISLNYKEGKLYGVTSETQEGG